MKLLDDDESLELLSLHAFGSKFPMKGYKELAEQVLRCCEGNPLALEVLGSSLLEDNSSPSWRSALNLLEKYIHSGIYRVLIRSYDSLPYDSDRELFLHIACFFIGKDMDYVVKILERDYSAVSKIKTLTKRCLLSVSPNKKLLMHPLLQEVGRTIVHQESPKDPAKRSRVWRNKESYDVLRKGKGSETMEGLALDMQMLREDKYAPKVIDDTKTYAFLEELKSGKGRRLELSDISVEEQKPQCLGAVGHINLNSRRAGTTSPYYFGSPTNMDFLQFPTSPFGSRLMPGSSIRLANYPSWRNEGMHGGWKAHIGNQVIDDAKTYYFLEELKSGKGQRLELSDISGHIVEFSVDRHGSRFIQQKLEVCSNEEKESVFKEVLPQASRLRTHVFGNYVIQKFFEYGSAEQRRELGNQLEGQILPLSLQMYGCHVIQKALDAIELEQKTKLVRELDGHVLKCVRDQNGNHVIRKCIESIPTEKIKFVISSFRGQVAALSTHSYGCCVIWRLLEHSTDELHSQFIVEEILESVYDLAQDQYGNYVTQRGKPEERSQIVHKLVGRIVQLSQEIIGFADGSDNLLAMLKDQFSNYVVHKVLQTCSGHQREVLLGRIKIHLNSLKKYTYGKHIVARFEQLYGEEIEASGSQLAADQ